MKVYFYLFFFIFLNSKLNSQTLNTKNYTLNNGLITSGVSSICFDENNCLWFCNREQGIFKFVNNNFIKSKIDLNVNLYKNSFLKVNNKIYFVNVDYNNVLSIFKVKDRKFLKIIDNIELIDFNSAIYSKLFFISNEFNHDLVYIIGQNSMLTVNLKTLKTKTIKYPLRLNLLNCYFVDNKLYLLSKEGLYSYDKVFKLIKKGEFVTLIGIKKENCLWLLTSNKLMKIKDSILLDVIDLNQNLKSTFYNTYNFKEFIFLYNQNEIVLFDTNTLIIKKIKQENGIIGGEYFDLISDHENNIWITSSLGICKLNYLNFMAISTEKLKIKGSEITSIVKTEKNNFFVSGNFGFSQLNKKFDHLYNYQFSDNNRQLRILDAIYSNKIGYNYTFNIGYGFFYNKKNSINEDKEQMFMSLYEINEFLIISGTYKLIYKNKYYKTINIYNIPVKRIRKIFKKNNNTLVLCSDSGFYENKLFTSKLVPILKNKNAYSYLEYKNLIFFGCKEGLFYQKNDSIHKILFPNYNVSVYALTIDIYNKLWIGTNFGVFVLFLNEFKLLRINDIININGIEVNRSAFLIDNNRILIGTNAALNIVPLKIETPSFTPPTLINFIKCNNQIINLNKKIFNFSENTFEFNFSINSYINEDENSFSYYLEGFESTWNEKIKNYEIRYTNLNPGTYTFKVMGINVFGVKSNIVSYSFTILPPWYRTWWFYSLVLITSGVLIFLLFKWRIKFVKKKTEEKQLITESELKALRSQINPHYLSNSLVSLQDSILKEEKYKAFEIVGQYGKVMRNILNNSEAQFVTLENEIQTLTEYINLEALLHFKNPDFKVIANLPNDLIKQIQLPSMLIQPFVENAILHGLKKKETDPKILKVTFNFNEYLTCEVDDNGVGRSNINPLEIRKSMGIKNIENRLKLYGDLLQQKINVEIIDKLDDNHQPCGTKVVVQLPFKKN